MDYKATLNLRPITFPMKADLARREPELLRRWDESRLYERVLDARRRDRSPLYVLHDGPPYANGHLHYGHILNKILKDIVCKYRTMSGRYVEYKPGWDCHGLPIELAVVRELGEQASAMSSVEIRRACDAYARRWIDAQRSEFRRLGVFGTWDHPYLTLDPEYEATVVRQLAGFAERGLLYKDLKPVHWCPTDATALAEAEIEYDPEHVSPSIYVKFALPEPGLFAVIWTTTPWTLPANLAIAYHPRFAYVTIAARGERYVVAEKLADSVVRDCHLEEEGERLPFPVERFATMRAARHPLDGRESLLVPGEHVTLEAGTGLVHTAPGHGADDFAIGKRFGLPIWAPVDDRGRFTEGPWQGESVFAANPKIVAALASAGALLSPPKATITHAYPICWRCKNPVIFRATPQWFAAMDDSNGHVQSQLRRLALAAIDRTEWIPSWGQSRIRGMIENRPDWVLSRQRVWGLPLPIFYRQSGGTQGQPVVDAQVMEHVATIFEKEGADAWFRRSAAELLPPDWLRQHPGEYVKEQAIVDVWFESGASWAAVCEGRAGLDNSRPEDPRPVDLYLEGSDQHRGWFHSALLTSAATRGRAPYRAVLTHGFVLDERGRPYSKSEIEKARREGRKIEYLEPEEVIKQQGAELLRLWVAQADFRSDVTFSRAHLIQLGEAYRKIRNTARFLIGNLYDFEPARDMVPVRAMTDPLDRYLVARTRAVEAELGGAYERFEFHVVFRALSEFAAEDLSSLYCDVRKDRLYCELADSPKRRAAQTILYDALGVLASYMAPIFCFTAEEMWSYMPHRSGDPDSVHLVVLSQGDLIEPPGNMKVWLDLRARVLAELEAFRARKKSSLDAHVILKMPPSDADPEWLADLFIVSKVTIEPEGGAPLIRIEPATGYKCERCWKWTPDQPICARCTQVLKERG